MIAKSLLRRMAVFVLGHVVLLGAVMMFAISVGNADSELETQASVQIVQD